MVLFIHRPALLGLSESPVDVAELVIAKNRSGEMGIINLVFNGDLVRFTEESESLSRIAAEKPPVQKQPQDKSAWERVNETVGSYNPFEAFEKNNTF